MEEWGSFAQQMLGKYVDARLADSYEHPYELQKMRLQALGQYGYYDEGRAGVYPQTLAAQQRISISPALLLVGGIVLVIMLAGD